MQHIEMRFAAIIIALLLLAGLIHLLGPVLMPFLIGALLAYLADPLVTRLMRFNVSRTVGSIIIFIWLALIFVLLILLLIPLIQKQIVLLSDMIPNSIVWLQTKILPWLQQNFGISEETINVEAFKKAFSENLSSAGGAVNWVLHQVVSSGAKLIEFVLSLILIPVVMFYLLCDWTKAVKGFQNLIPRASEPVVSRLITECDSVLGAFFRGQFLVMLSLAFIYSVGLSLIGLQIGIIIGLISGMLTIVPYLGSIVGVVSASIAAFVQFGTFSSVLWVWLVFAVGEVLENTVLTPRLVGDRIGLHPVVVIFAVLAGGSLFGFLGVLLALPVAAVIMVWVRFLHKRYRRSELYKKS